VKDSASFIKELKDIKLSPKDILVSFDVVSLYTYIPIKESLEVIYRLTDPDTAHLVEICLTSTFFYFEGEFFEHTCGVAMGSPLSPIVVNLFMEDFEAKDLSSSCLLPKLLKRYVDNANVIWPHGPEEIDHFFNHLNSQSFAIKFTMEKEVNGCLPFLDILILGVRMDISPTLCFERRCIFSSIFMLIAIISLLRSWVFLPPSLLVPLGSLIVRALIRRDPISLMSLWRMDIVGA